MSKFKHGDIVRVISLEFVHQYLTNWRGLNGLSREELARYSYGGTPLACCNYKIIGIGEFHNRCHLCIIEEIDDILKHRKIFIVDERGLTLVKTYPSVGDIVTLVSEDKYTLPYFNEWFEANMPNLSGRYCYGAEKVSIDYEYKILGFKRNVDEDDTRFYAVSPIAKRDGTILSEPENTKVYLIKDEGLVKVS